MKKRISEYLMKKRIGVYFVVAILVPVIFPSCCVLCLSMVNEKGWDEDLYCSNDTISFEAGLGWSILGSHALLDFDENFLYGFDFSIRDSSYYDTMEDPDIIIHDLSFTSNKGDTICNDLFYYNCNNLKERNGRCGVDMINQPNLVFPLKITRDMKVSEGIRHRYVIFALSRMPINEFKKIYVNYDIEVYGKRYKVRSLYRWKVELDCRPKIW